MKASVTSKNVSSKRNKIIALAVALVVATAGYALVVSRATGFFASVSPASATLTGNAKVITESDGSKAVQFNAPATTPPTPPPTTPQPATGAQSCPSYPAFPGANCTGVPNGTTPILVNGDVTLSTPGMVYDARDVTGTIYVQADNITIKRTIARQGIQIRGWEGVKGLVIEDSEIGPVTGSGGDDGIAFSDYTCRRCDIHGFSDGAKINGNVLIEDSWVHDLFIKEGDHADGLQNYNGNGNVTIRHSSITLGTGANAAIFMADNPSGTMLIENNLLSGGQYTLQFLDNAGYTAIARGNYFVRGTYTYGTHRLHQDPSKVTWENNFLVNWTSGTDVFSDKQALPR